MIGLQFDRLQTNDAARRRCSFDGQILVYPAQRSTAALCDSAREAIQLTFSPRDAQTAQFDRPVEEFIALVGPLKSGFTNSPRTKELVRDVLADFGCDLDKTYFDVPRLRVVTSNSYLTAGVGYAYKPH